MELLFSFFASPASILYLCRFAFKLAFVTLGHTELRVKGQISFMIHYVSWKGQITKMEMKKGKQMRGREREEWNNEGKW